jgi:hypothetical protein
VTLLEKHVLIPNSVYLLAYCSCTSTNPWCETDKPIKHHESQKGALVITVRKGRNSVRNFGKSFNKQSSVS